ncbi:hypothetical protein [Maritalea porphyrae]|jgi:hypothetical protein|uniref:hypothetical protein n=1 Tax=Maritalea porphyrae TaxID=880732 RepID=UPI0022AFF02B|nr:hypothetical protein [Maritalea porphyrae]MCZ4272805.1 hypothetical protein [Maritalea porphyrae]
MNIKNTLLAIVLGFALSMSAGSIAQAADNEPPEITFDNGQLFENCMLDGGKTKNGKKTYSCSHGGTTTTCDKKPVDKDAPCSTEENAKRSKGFAKTKFGSNTVLTFKR